jgi:hypothetical protein
MVDESDVEWCASAESDALQDAVSTDVNLEDGAKRVAQHPGGALARRDAIRGGNGDARPNARRADIDPEQAGGATSPYLRVHDPD